MDHQKTDGSKLGSLVLLTTSFKNYLFAGQQRNKIIFNSVEIKSHAIIDIWMQLKDSLKINLKDKDLFPQQTKPMARTIVCLKVDIDIMLLLRRRSVKRMRIQACLLLSMGCGYGPPLA